MKDKFVCPKCGLEHLYETLIEYPLPGAISDVTSGRKAGELKVISKNAYTIQGVLLLLCILRIPITEIDDSLEIHTWAQINKEELAKVRDRVKENYNASLAEDLEILMTGSLVYPIPTYGLSDYPIVKVDYLSTGLFPEVKLIHSTTKLYQDWKYGITLKKLETILIHLIHGL